MSSNDPSENGSAGHLPEPVANGHASNGALTPFNGQVRHDLAHPMAGRPAVLSTAPNAPALLKALRRRWLLAACLAVPFAAAVFAAVWFFLPSSKATVSAKIDIPATPPTVFGPNAMLGKEFGSNSQTQAARVKSRLVLNRALNDREVLQTDLSVLRDRDPISWLEQELKVDFPSGPEILRVSLVGDQIDELIILVNAVVKAYLEEFLGEQTISLQERIKKMKEVVDLRRGQVTQLEKTRDELAIFVGATQDQAVELRQKRAQGWIDFEERELQNTLKEIAKLMREQRYYKEVLDGRRGSIPKSIVDKQIESNSEIVELHKVEALYKKWIQAAMRDAADGENSPVVRKHKLKLQETEKAIEKLRQELRPAVEKELRTRAGAEAQAQLDAIKEALPELNKIENEQREHIKNLEQHAQKVNRNSLGMESLNRDIKLADASLTRIATKLDELTSETGPTGGNALLRVKKLEDATAFQPDELPRKLRYASLAAASAFALVLFLVAFLEFRSRRIDSVDEVVHGLGLRLMGTLPANPMRIHQRLLAPTSNGAQWSTLLAESVNSARTMLLHAARSGGLRVVMVTSAVGGEGKTSLATHLAASLARAGRKTLLLDCDLRKPAAHRLFDLPLAPGFSELLRGEVDVAEALQATSAPGLWMITAGQCDAQALQTLAQDGSQKTLEQLRPQFDFIVVDSSPVLPVADSLLIAQHVDGVLFSILREVSRLPKVYAAYQRLAMLGVPMVGAVVNGTLDDQYSYGSRTVNVSGA
jgi:capsular exopolysaccharide synthesis family protein